MSDFTHLHVHSRFSIRDALPNPEQLIKRAQELGFEALATTDHGNMGAHYQFAIAAQNTPIKMIYGVEAYLCKDVTVQESITVQDAKTGSLRKRRPKHNHIVLQAMNDVGYSNLLNLHYEAVQNFYYEPRIDWKILEKYSEGLICLTACLGGELASQFLQNNPDEAKIIAQRYLELFDDRLYFEVQCHGMPDEEKAYQEIEKLADLMEIPLVATNDVHYVRREDASTHDMVVSMRFSKNEKEGGSGDVRDLNVAYKDPDFYMKSAEEMMDIFERRPDAIRHTQEIVERCSFVFPLTHKIIWPVSELNPDEVPIIEEWRCSHVPEQSIKQAYLTRESLKGLKVLGFYDDPIYRERLKYELNTIFDLGCEDYFIIQRKICQWCEANNIMMGPGRGSGAGSLVLYSLGITRLNPIEMGLLFERFLNAGRGPQFDHELPIFKESL